MSERTTRSYTSSLRAEQAAATRRRILGAAGECFSRAGYAGTSLRDIADAAGVSVETVKLNGPKSSLLTGAFEVAFTGAEGEARIEERDVGREMLGTDGGDFLPAMIDFIAEANRRASKLWMVLVSASTSDAAVQEWFDGVSSRRKVDMRNAVAEMDRRGMIQWDTDRDRLAEVLWFLVSPEGFEQLVGDAGWEPGDYRTWLESAVRALVLGASTPVG